MGFRLLRWITLGSVVGATLAITTAKGGISWVAIFFLGFIGACLGAIGGGIVLLTQPRIRSKTNGCALTGAVACSLGGVPVGVALGLGRPMLALFNPDLPPTDFEAVFGGIGGMFLGAVCGALGGALVARALGGRTGDSGDPGSR